jgi:hypothetical protein
MKKNNKNKNIIGKKKSMIVGTRPLYNGNVINYKKSNEHIKHESIPYYVVWENISFEDNKIRFSPDSLGTFLNAVKFPGIIEELNDIKKEYFIKNFRNDVYKLYFYKNILQKDISKDWIKLISRIKIGQQYFYFETSKKSKFLNGITVQEALSLNYFQEKTQFLKYLATLQEEFAIIPIIEIRNNFRENSFLFRLKSNNGQVIIIWENVNPTRAAHVFKSSVENHEKILSTIESFICSDMPLKRSLLYENSQYFNKMKFELGYVSSIRHTDIIKFRDEIQEIINNF